MSDLVPVVSEAVLLDLSIGEARFMWDSSPGADAYRVTYRRTGNYPNVVLIVTTNSVTIPTERGAEYRLFVQAFNKHGISPNSRTLSYIGK